MSQRKRAKLLAMEKVPWMRLASKASVCETSAETSEHEVWKDTVKGTGNGMEMTKVVDFPEELVEKIMSKLPFPAVFKARILSRTWYFKFPLPSQCVRSLSPSLQNQITAVSQKWATYCPVFFSKEEILGFDRALSRWQPMLTLGYLPVTVWSSISSGGSLVCVISESDLGYNIFVTNVLTRSWRKLPDRPFCEEPDHVRLLPMDSNSYKVLLVYRRCHDEDGVHTQVYDSSQRSWTVKKSMVDLDTFFVNSAFLNGKLYCMCRDSILDPLQLWTYDLDSNDWISIFHDFSADDVMDGAILLCNDKIMVAIWFSVEDVQVIGEVNDKLCGLYTHKNSIGIYQLDLDYLSLEQVSRGPPDLTVGVGLRNRQVLFASDAGYIYFGQDVPNSPVLTFDVHKNVWGCLPAACYTFGSMDNKTWHEIPFEPGLNPFVMV